MKLCECFSRWRIKRRLKHYAIPDDLWEATLQALPFLRHWSAERLLTLRDMTVLFLCEKSIIGAKGFRVQPFHRVVVATQACVPVLNLGLAYYDDFQTVVLYPGEFIVDNDWEDENGIVHQDCEPLMGEAIEGGPVVLSWLDAIDPGRSAETTDANPPINVVIHEFAHKIDMRGGDAGSAPSLPRSIAPERWQETMRNAYQDFCMRVESGEEVAIDPYAAENPAEFFAVFSETFFVAPEILEREYPEVFALLKIFYG
ncbi:MAG: zinc-dependent peptidase [Burkholderiales bacterium]|jgi:Mlc titration factor MtfA (ptsG expression regulator)|nr:zinc-dependent peptidase [Burkholderiales bacterium]